MSSPHCQLSGVFAKFVYLFQFQFVNSFLSLFYIAFYLQDMEKLKEVIVCFEMINPGTNTLFICTCVRLLSVCYIMSM